MFRSQPDLEMGERTVPIEDLNDEGKNQTGNMEDLDGLISYSPDCTEKEKEDPEEMD